MPPSPERLRIIINIDVLPGKSGGISQSTQGLVSSVGGLEGPERYLLVAESGDAADWIKQFRGPNQEVVVKPSGHRAGSVFGRRQGDSWAKRALRPVEQGVRWMVGRLSPQSDWPSIPVSTGYYESLGCDVVHFPTQGFVLCALPTIFNPHDLQHLHYPQFWSAGELARREVIYPGACHFAQTVVVGSEWIKQDVIRQYGTHPDKVQVIPWAPPTAHYPRIDGAGWEERKRRLELPDAYAFYPAVTWPHKNHLRLFEALANLRDNRNLVVHLVCTGARYDSHWPKIEEAVKRFELGSQVRFMGFLSEADLRTVYQFAQFLVLPSLFEADSCPIYEAWAEGVAVASSNHTALPEQVGDAGLLFDAGDVAAIADAVQTMATDADLRQDLIARGHRRVKDFDWTRTAKAFRAVYRRAAGATLNDEDRWLLQWDWMREPNKSPTT